MVRAVERRSKFFAGQAWLAGGPILLVAAASAAASACSDDFEGCEASLDCTTPGVETGGQGGDGTGAGEGGAAGDVAGPSGGSDASGGAASEGGAAGESSGGGGGDSSTESCVPAECDTPPSNDCTDPNTLLVYENTGECVEGECSYESSTRHCAAGCTVDACDGNEWIPLTDVNVPGSRHSHSAVWTGTEMIVWGGAVSAPSVYLQDGGRFNPARDDADAWIPLTTNGAPTTRADHTAVWTGKEMIVWGGSTYSASGSVLGTGGRYNPTSGWTFTNNTNAPAARTGHTAVWTGKEMIVWGGFTTVPVASGGRYVAADNEWITAPTSTGAPSPRQQHTAVWTGTEMIIWGGNGDTTGDPAPLGSGARYDPEKNEWTAVSTTNAPSPRFSHTAVWTGSEMIVWGGDGTSDGTPGPLDSGGRYDPKTNTWAPLPSQTPRRLHTAIWTGSEMIVWGGYGTSSNVEQGAIYDPTDDEWTPLPVGPAGRTSHTAVWTGTEMIVWGGAIGGPGTSSGGRYVR